MFKRARGFIHTLQVTSYSSDIKLPRVLSTALLLVSALLFSASSVSALTIDELNGSQTAIANQNSPQSFSGNTFTGTVGGARKVLVSWLSGANSPTLDAHAVIVQQGVDGTIAFSQDATVAAQCQIRWDGTTVNSTSQTLAAPEGIDLRQDGGTAFTVEVLGNDLPTVVEMSVTQVNDASRVSTASLALDAGGPRTVSIPFSSFSGSADFSAVGALSLLLNKNGSQAVDLSLTYVGTNGSCRLVPNAQGRVIDECGVCGGDNASCADCAGIPNGSTVIDQCGVCGGDGTSCLDCRGAVNGPAQLDRCGVCEGDGTSCLSCTENDITFTLAQLDAAAKSQEAIIKTIYRRAQPYARRATTRKNIRRMLDQAHALQVRNWILSWTVPRINRVCANQQFCVSVSNAPILEEYRRNSQSLKQMTTDALKLWRKLTPKARPHMNSFQRMANRQHAANMALANTVPETQSVCS